MADGVRAVVADDSHFMRSVISDILSDGGIDVVAQARDGEEAVSAVIEHKPDVVTMDVEMPVMNGIEATERIMAECPTPVLMLSAHTDENADVTFEALDKGAVDFFTKPGGEVSMEMSRLKDQLVEIVVSVAAVDVGTTKSGGANSGDGTGSTAAGGSATDRTGAGAAAGQTTYVANPTLVIGSSTGGPKMVEQVMEGLPIEADLRVLIIQHMPEGFTGRFAERINTRSEYEVREATDGARIGGGEGLVAAGDRHMVVKNYRNGRLRTKLTQDEPVNSVRPAVDVTMRSAAETIDDPLVGLILTGMGEDGADGIRRIKQAGGETIAQDEATSAVYGMPKRAVETGCVDTVLPIDDIADGIIDAITTEVT
ncbi:chemotaxis-specific protein-glutamate methyltransferase CheB [Haloarcula sp. S1AR25-5A]|uniref:Protein-glutamate methylesterase/protein-glutamine glutaminase n=1 Tax=Haloarcula terrestris TaxID=2950533 RepID=A0AAE4JFQ9_9EURY|nr:chemotaxis-specific protein-glutamate methyltransferase CheB [Haloarcula terrestris]MDS0219830.1 chemotaxis-specific protein-glutamate methyltransferase CheB [Haloarcula terrestris]